MHIAFIDHSYHKQTRSTQFFKELISGIGDVQVFYDESWCHGQNEWQANFAEDDFDLIIIWQVPEAFRVLSGKHKNVVFVPMYDAMFVGNSFYWNEQFAQARCLAFSRHLHRELQIRGARSEYFRFVPDPSSFKAVTDFNKLKPYFWYRTTTIGLERILQFCRQNEVEGLTIHNVPDPGQRPLSNRKLKSQFPRITISDWYNTYDEYLNELHEHNIYFAPRPAEGIGFSFLEAMASGMCVVAPNRPTMNEYISNGTNGLLYSMDNTFPLSLSKAKDIGGRARETIERGFVDWQNQRQRLIDFLTDQNTASKRSLTASAPATTPETKTSPKLSIVTVCLNAEGVLQKTIESVLEQDYDNFEYLILDGASVDTTPKIVQWYEPHLSYWHSHEDHGVYHAMNDAVAKSTGDFVLFMNAGDLFSDSTSLRRMFARAPLGADVVYGHHLYIPADGVPEYHPTADFETTYSLLANGYVSHDWLAGIPGHQATAVRRTLLADLLFDTNYQIAADHDLLFRATLKGATFFNSDELVSIYMGGGMSAQNYDLCKEEWKAIARRYGDIAGVDRFYGAMDLRGNVVNSIFGLGILRRALKSLTKLTRTSA